MRLFTLAGFLILLLTSTPGLAAEMTVYKDPSCGCCGNWIKHIKAAGHTVKTVNTEDMDRIKKTFGVPEAVQSCHTALVDGYVIEGHVPAADINRLLAERPKARGLAVPGMPTGAPGMEMPDMKPDHYDVYLFNAKGGSVYSRH
jgi:hypothetical protein